MISSQSKIDFRSIRPHRRGQDGGFEELVRQLVLTNPPENLLKIENRGSGPDGGVEVLAWLENGDCIGWQAKYFIDDFGSNQIQQIKESFETAIKCYPTLTDYYVAIPRNLSGAAQGRQKTQQKRWKDFCSKAAENLEKKNRKVNLHLWDESHLISYLTKPDPTHAGMHLYWFNDQMFTGDWFKRKLNPTLADLGERYTSDLNVDVSIQSEIDVIQRNETFLDRIVSCQNALNTSFKLFSELESKTLAQDEFTKSRDYIILELKKIIDLFKEIDWSKDACINSLGFIQNYSTNLRRSAELDLIRTTTFKLSNRNDLKHEEQSDRNQLGTANSEIHKFFNRIEEIDIFNLLETPFLLVSGDAGSGKSHLLAHTAETHVNQDLPAVLILGQHLSGSDPRQEILNKLGLTGLTFEEFLGTLQASAEASEKPALILVDAINDATYPHKWKNTLAGICEEIRQFDRLALILSCRSNYEKYCMPNHWLGSKVLHQGFEGNEEEAAKLILDRNGISRPSTPFLNPEFSNPLFLTTVAKSLKRKGRTIFPTGLDGISSILKLWISSVEETLISKGYKGLKPHDDRIMKSLNQFAVEMTLEKVEALDIAKSKEIFNGNNDSSYLENPENLLQQLINEGVLRREPDYDTEKEKIAFTFQRFSDHFIAKNILELFDTTEALATAIMPDGEYAYLFNGENWQHLGIVEALYIQVPEKFGCELPLIEKEIAQQVTFPISEFINSLIWRAPQTTSNDTSGLFTALMENQNIQIDDYFDILIRLSALPSHALNAKFLHQNLINQELSERDLRWSQYLSQNDFKINSIHTLIEWAWQTKDENVEIERLELVAIVLCWSFSTTNRQVRDRATKALATLFYLHPELGAAITDLFLEVNDPYITERLLASLCGAFLHSSNSETAHKDISKKIYNSIFNKEPCAVHAYIRRYARSIIESAINRYGCFEGIDPEKIRPPYSSQKIADWPNSTDLHAVAEHAPRICHSVIGHYSEKNKRFEMPWDFGRYTMISLSHEFSKSTRSDTPPRSPEMEKEAFWNEVEALGVEVKNLADEARSKKESFSSRLWLAKLLRSQTDDSTTIISPYKSSEEIDFQIAEDNLLNSLTDELKSRYLDLSPYPENGDNKIPLFCLSKAQRWVAARAINLGNFDEENHEPKDTGISWGKMEHSIERLGKKYQWIAWHEMIGYLMDYHWYISWDNQVFALESPDLFQPTDIDPSYLEKRATVLNDETYLPKIEFPEMVFNCVNLEEAIAWSKIIDDIPEIPIFIDQMSGDHNLWWIVDAYYRDGEYYKKLKSEDLFKTSQWWIETSFAPTQHLESLYSLVKNTNIMGTTFANPQDDCRTRLFGEYQAGLNHFDIESLLNAKFKNIPIGSIIQSHRAIREQYDFSGDSGTSFLVPAPQLIENLYLRPKNPWSREFINAQNEIVFSDIIPRSFESSYAVMRADILDRFLKDNDLTPIWFFKCEKDAGLGSGEHFTRMENFNRQAFCGMWWRNETGWQGSNWFALAP